MPYGRFVLIGHCGLCGGPVGKWSIWTSNHERPAQCADCSAEAKVEKGPVVEMKRVKQEIENVR